MAINRILKLKDNKETHPVFTRPVQGDEYYLSSADYNELVRALKEFAIDYSQKIGSLHPDDVISLITSTSGRSSDDITAYSSKRVDKEISDRIGGNKFLSKEAKGDTAAGKINFMQGIEFSANQLDPFHIDETGAAVLRSLKLTESLEIPELLYNRIEINTGDKWRAPGGGIVETVTTSNDGTRLLGTIHLKLDPGTLGTVSVGDICMGIYHSLDTSQNAEQDVDTMIVGGTRKHKGFATTFFKVLSVEGDSRQTITYELREDTVIHPQEGMNFVAYGNFTNISRQQSVYETRTYQRYLTGINNWAYTRSNVAAQFGSLNNLNDPQIKESDGYSIYLNDVYFSGNIKQMKAPIIKNGTWHTWVGKDDPTADGEGWYDTRVPATGKGINVNIANDVVHVVGDNLENTWAEISVFEGETELDFVEGVPTFGEYGVEVSSEGISVGELTKVTEDRTTRAKLLPSTEMLGDSALITFKITGEDRLGSGFRITKTQSISRVTPGKDGENAKAPKIIDGYWAFWSDINQGWEKSEFSAVGDDGHSPHVDEGTGTWWEWDPNATPPDYRDTGITAEGKQGKEGKGIAAVYRGEFSGTSKYFASAVRCDVVKYLNEWYRTKVITGDAIETIQGILPTNENYWISWGGNFESIATELLLAEGAHIANFLFVDGKMISQEGILDKTIIKNYGDLDLEEQTPGRWIPNLMLDGATGQVLANNVRISGEIQATSLKTSIKDSKASVEIDEAGMKVFNDQGVMNIEFGLNEEGYAVMKYFDNQGRLLYDLGPSGISKVAIREEKWVEIKLVEIASSFEEAVTSNDWKYKDTRNLTPVTFYRYEAKMVAGSLEDPNNADGKIFQTMSTTGDLISPFKCYTEKTVGDHMEMLTGGTNKKMTPEELPQYIEGNEAVFDRYPLFYKRLSMCLDGKNFKTKYAYWNGGGPFVPEI